MVQLVPGVMVLVLIRVLVVVVLLVARKAVLEHTIQLLVLAVLLSSDAKFQQQKLLQ